LDFFYSVEIWKYAGKITLFGIGAGKAIYLQEQWIFAILPEMGSDLQIFQYAIMELSSHSEAAASQIEFFLVYQPILVYNHFNQPFLV
jgi:hypothetical protein